MTFLGGSRNDIFGGLLRLCHCEQSEAICGFVDVIVWDCFVAALLAMTFLGGSHNDIFRPPGYVVIASKAKQSVDS